MDNQFPNEPAPPPRQVQVRVQLPTVQPILTHLILGIIALVFIYANSLTIIQQNEFLEDWAKINEFIDDGEYYRLFTSMFIHLDFLHVALNGYALYYFGREVERLYGYFRFAIVYFIGGLAGSVASYMYTDAPSIGASGAIFAIFSALGVYFYHHRHLYGKGADRRVMQMVFWGAFNILLGFSLSSRIDNAAHIGGMLGGIILSWFICPELKITGMDVPYGQIPEPKIEDVNRLQDWIIVPILITIGLVIMVVLLSSQASS